jgi:outer membrane biosynthesis protein TonB
MLSTSRPSQPKEGRTLAVALALSLLIHLIGFLFYAQSAALLKLAHVHLPEPKATPTPEFVTTSQAITIEHRAHPVPHPPSRRAAPPPRPRVAQVAPQPPPVPAPRPVERPQPVRKPVVIPTLPPPSPFKAELRKQAPRATPAPSPVPSPKTIVYRPPRVQVPEQTQAEPNHPQHPRLTQAQIAQLQQNFSQTIAQSRNLADPLRVVPATPAAPKRYKVQLQGHFGGLHGGEGEYWPVQSFSDHGLDCYYVVYDFQYESGEYEHGNVPWPVCFPPRSDWFSFPHEPGSVGPPLPPPPAGWKLPGGVQLGKALRRFVPGLKSPDD